MSGNFLVEMNTKINSEFSAFAVKISHFNELQTNLVS